MFIWRIVKWFFRRLVRRAAPGLRGGALSTVVTGLIGEGGTGLNALLDMFSKGGLGGLVQSWVGKGPNLPLSAEQLKSILGANAVSEIATKLGTSGDAAAVKVSRTLPELIDKLTPDGQVPDKETVGQRLVEALREWSI